MAEIFKDSSYSTPRVHNKYLIEKYRDAARKRDAALTAAMQEQLSQTDSNERPDTVLSVEDRLILALMAQKAAFSIAVSDHEVERPLSDAARAHAITQANENILSILNVYEAGPDQ